MMKPDNPFQVLRLVSLSLPKQVHQIFCVFLFMKTNLQKIDVHQRPDNINIDEETGDLLVVGGDQVFDLSADPPTQSTSVSEVNAYSVPV